MKQKFLTGTFSFSSVSIVQVAWIGTWRNEAIQQIRDNWNFHRKFQVIRYFPNMLLMFWNDQNTKMHVIFYYLIGENQYFSQRCWPFNAFRCHYRILSYWYFRIITISFWCCRRRWIRIKYLTSDCNSMNSTIRTCIVSIYCNWIILQFSASAGKSNIAYWTRTANLSLSPPLLVITIPFSNKLWICSTMEHYNKSLFGWCTPSQASKIIVASTWSRKGGGISTNVHCTGQKDLP